MAATSYKPDRGYAWMVVAACFAINFIMAGLARVAGVLYIALIDDYAISREAATAPFSLRFCIRNLSGPLVGVWGQRFGIRPVVLLGGIICCIGGIVCSVAPDVTWITVAWGGIHGIGYGMCNIIHHLMITRYFHKYKGIAVGIALAGDCVGTFLLPILLEYLLYVYDLKGTFLILAGLSLNVVPAAMLLIAPQWEAPGFNRDCRTLQNGDGVLHNYGVDNIAFEYEADLKVTYTHNVEGNVSDLGKPKLVTANVSNPILKEFLHGRYEDNEFRNIIKQPRIMSSSSIDLNGARLVSSCFSQVGAENTNQKSNLVVPNTFQSELRRKSALPTYEANRRNSQLSILSCPATTYRENSRFLDVPKSFDGYLVPDEFTQSVTPLPKSQYSVHDMADKEVRDIPVKDMRDVLSKDIRDMPGKELPLSKSDREELKTMYCYYTDCGNLEFLKEGITSKEACDTNSLNKLSIKSSEPSALRQFIRTNTKPMFFLISVTMALYVFMFISVFTIIIDYALDSDIPIEYGKYLLVAFSLADLFGRLGFGVVLDRRWVTISHYAGLTTGIMGLFIFIMPFSTNVFFWMVSFSGCGFVQGGCAVMYPILVEHYMEKQEVSVAMGSLNFYGGLLTLPIPPMIGYFRDVIGTYDGVFWTTGGLCMLVGCLWILEPCLLRLNRARGGSKDLNYHTKDEKI